MATSYTAYDKDGAFGSDDAEGIELTATNDNQARKEARKIAQEKNWGDVGITFFRSSDHCRGEIDP